MGFFWLITYLIIHDVVDGFGGRAVSEGGLHVDHLIGDDSQGPPVALHPIAGLPTTERGQNLWREEVLGTSRKLGRANLSTGKQKEPIIFQVKLLPYSSASIPGLIKDLFDLAMEMLHESIMNNSEYIEKQVLKIRCNTSCQMHFRLFIAVNPHKPYCVLHYPPTTPLCYRHGLRN